jgi:hypothetical protein
MASLRIRDSRAGSATRRPPGSKYLNCRPRRTRRMPGLQSLVNSRLIENTPQNPLLPPGGQLPPRRRPRQAHCIGQCRVLVGECSHRFARRTAKYVPSLSVYSANPVHTSRFRSFFSLFHASLLTADRPAGLLPGPSKERSQALCRTAPTAARESSGPLPASPSDFGARAPQVTCLPPNDSLPDGRLKKKVASKW